MISRFTCAILLAAVGLFGGSVTSRPEARAAQPRLGQAVAESERQEGDLQRVRIAEGEYKVYRQTNAGGIGPFATGVYDFRESWTLWRLPDGSLVVDGERIYSSPQYEQHDDRFSVHLSSDFRALNVKEFRKLRWQPDSGPLSCDFLPDKLACTSGAKDPANAIRLDMPVRSPYGLLWPISAFSLGHITRFAGRNPGDKVPVQMVTIDEPSKEDPVFSSALAGQLRYLGREAIRVAGRKWQADKFELQVALHAPFIIWTSRQGLLLDFAEEDKKKRLTETGMRLVSFQQWKDL